ncbi:hypothetical protein ABZ345_46120 [Lentzea sp. NPDC005914]|uniref:hypothetical protein n=1 Tax=Lentzea sp. NPDC005914 TaxID=3154572 RepID=UPI0033C02542
MLRELSSWLDEYLSSEGPPAIAKAVLGIVSVAALPGAVFGSLLVKVVALVVAVCAITALGLVLLADRSSLRRELEEQQRLVDRYCRHIRQEKDLFYQMTSWHEVCVVTDDRGTTDDVIRIRMRVLRPDMLFFRFRFSCNWAQPARYRGRVQTQIRSIKVDGAPGIRLRTTRSWVADGKMYLTAHFDAPPRAGSEISLAMRVRWPQRCAPLMGSGQPDTFVLRFSQPIPHARYEVILPTRREAFCEPLGFDHGDEGFSLTPESDADGRTHHVFEAFDLEAGHEAGMKLELKRRGDLANSSPQQIYRSTRRQSSSSPLSPPAKT